MSQLRIIGFWTFVFGPWQRTGYRTRLVVRETASYVLLRGYEEVHNFKTGESAWLRDTTITDSVRPK